MRGSITNAQSDEKTMNPPPPLVTMTSRQFGRRAMRWLAWRAGLAFAFILLLGWVVANLLLFMSLRQGGASGDFR